jgi:hypothetical protein
VRAGILRMCGSSPYEEGSTREAGNHRQHLHFEDADLPSRIKRHFSKCGNFKSGYFFKSSLF